MGEGTETQPAGDTSNTEGGGPDGSVVVSEGQLAAASTLVLPPSAPAADGFQDGLEWFLGQGVSQAGLQTALDFARDLLPLDADAATWLITIAEHIDDPDQQRLRDLIARLTLLLSTPAGLQRFGITRERAEHLLQHARHRLHASERGDLVDSFLHRVAQAQSIVYVGRDDKEVTGAIAQTVQEAAKTIAELTSRLTTEPENRKAIETQIHTVRQATLALIEQREDDIRRRLEQAIRDRDSAITDGNGDEAKRQSQMIEDCTSELLHLLQARALTEIAGSQDPAGALRDFLRQQTKLHETTIDKIIEEFNKLTGDDQRRAKKGDLADQLRHRIEGLQRWWAEQDAINDLIMQLDPGERDREIAKLRDLLLGEVRPDKQEEGWRTLGLPGRIHNAHGFGNYVEEQLLTIQLQYVERRLIQLILTDPRLTEVEKIKKYRDLIEENAKLHEGEKYPWNPLFDLPGCNPNDAQKAQSDEWRKQATFETVPALVNRLITGGVEDPQEFFGLIAELLTDDIHRMWVTYTEYLATDSWHRGLTQAYRILFPGSEHGMNTVLGKIAIDSEERQALEHALRTASHTTADQLNDRDKQVLLAHGFIGPDGKYVVPKGFKYDPNTIGDDESKRTTLDQITVTATLELLATVVIPGAGAARIARFIENPLARLLVEQLLFTLGSTGAQVAIDPLKLRDLTPGQFVKELTINLITAGTFHGIGFVGKGLEQAILKEGQLTIEKMLQKPFNQLTKEEITRLLISKGFAGGVEVTVMTVINKLQNGQKITLEEALLTGLTLLQIKGLGGFFGFDDEPRRRGQGPRDAITERDPKTGKPSELTIKRSPQGTKVQARDLEAFGMLPETVKHIQRVLDFINMWSSNLTGLTFEIRIRPTNPDSLPWLAKGHPGKPEPIKAKTIDWRDVVGGWARGEDIGLVGYFDPKTIDLTKLQERVDKGEIGKDVLERAEQRLKEHEDEKEMINELKEKKLIEITKDGVVIDKGVCDYGLDEHHKLYKRNPEGKDGGTGLAIAGDPDTYVIMDSKGRIVDAKTAEPIIRAIEELKHGALLNWHPETEKDKNIMAKIVAGHQGTELPSGVIIPATEKAEALIVFRGSVQPTVTAYHDYKLLGRDQAAKVEKLTHELTEGNTRVVTKQETLRQLIERQQVTGQDLTKEIELARRDLDRATVARNDTAKEISKITGQGVNVGAFGGTTPNQPPLTPENAKGREPGASVKGEDAPKGNETPLNPNVLRKEMEKDGGKPSDDDDIWIYDPVTGHAYYYGKAKDHPGTLGGDIPARGEDKKQEDIPVDDPLIEALLRLGKVPEGEKPPAGSDVLTPGTKQGSGEGVKPPAKETAKTNEPAHSEIHEETSDEWEARHQKELQEQAKHDAQKPQQPVAPRTRADVQRELDELVKQRDEIIKNGGDPMAVNRVIVHDMEELDRMTQEERKRAMEHPKTAIQPQRPVQPQKQPEDHEVVKQRAKLRELDREIREQEKVRDDQRKHDDPGADDTEAGIERMKERRKKEEEKLKELEKHAHDKAQIPVTPKPVTTVPPAKPSSGNGATKTDTAKKEDKPKTAQPTQTNEQPREGETSDEWEERHRREQSGEQPKTDKPAETPKADTPKTDTPAPTGTERQEEIDRLNEQIKREEGELVRMKDRGADQETVDEQKKRIDELIEQRKKLEEEQPKETQQPEKPAAPRNQEEIDRLNEQIKREEGELIRMKDRGADQETIDEQKKRVEELKKQRGELQEQSKRTDDGTTGQQSTFRETAGRIYESVTSFVGMSLIAGGAAVGTLTTIPVTVQPTNPVTHQTSQLTVTTQKPQDGGQYYLDNGTPRNIPGAPQIQSGTTYVDQGGTLHTTITFTGDPNAWTQQFDAGAFIVIIYYDGGKGQINLGVGGGNVSVTTGGDISTTPAVTLTGNTINVSLPKGGTPPDTWAVNVYTQRYFDDPLEHSDLGVSPQGDTTLPVDQPSPPSDTAQIADSSAAAGGVEGGLIGAFIGMIMAALAAPLVAPKKKAKPKRKPRDCSKQMKAYEDAQKQVTALSQQVAADSAAVDAAQQSVQSAQNTLNQFNDQGQWTGQGPQPIIDVGTTTYIDREEHKIGKAAPTAGDVKRGSFGSRPFNKNDANNDLLNAQAALEDATQALNADMAALNAAQAAANAAWNALMNCQKGS